MLPIQNLSQLNILGKYCFSSLFIF